MALVSNKNFYRNYESIDEYECGIVLTGTEVKSISASQASINEAYAIFSKNEMFILNMHVKNFEQGNMFNVDPYRNRKLLLHRSELIKINYQIQKNGLTAVPVKLYWKKNKIKVLLSIARGKKQFDKREDIKKRDIERQIQKGIY